jgi:MFS family permease
LSGRFGERFVLVGALLLVLAGLALLTRAPVNASYVTDFLPSTVLMGVGAGLGFPAMMTLAMSGVTKDDSGLASGLVNTTQQVGGALGLAVLATLSTSRTNGLLAAGESPVEAMTSGFRLAFGVGAALVAVAVGLAVFVLRRPEPDEADEVAVPLRVQVEVS